MRRLGRLERVNISSGDPMAGLELWLSDLFSLTKAILAPIARAPDLEGGQ